jgi:hypothetical protein
MNRRSLLLALLCLLVGIAAPLPATAKPTAPVAWTPEEAMLPQLSPATTLGLFKIRPPKGYSASSQTSPTGAEAFNWVSAPRADGTRAYLMVVMLDLPGSEAKKMTPDKMLGQFLIGISRTRGSDWKRTPTEKGVINGIPFVRARWSGSTPDGALMMHGFNYVCIVDGLVIQLSSQDIAPGHAEPLNLAETAALTLQKNG